MPHAIRHLFRLLLAGVFTLALLGAAPHVAAAADCGYSAETGCCGSTDALPEVDVQSDGDIHTAADAKLIVLAGYAITAADPPLTRRATGVRLGHWPHAPPL